MKKIRILTLLLLTMSLILASPYSVQSKTGVGIGIGKINIDDALNPGGVYHLPSIPIINTGDQTTTYEITLSHFAEQAELKPDPTWVRFSPEKITLEPGASGTTDVTLSLPLKATPGNYFALLQATPLSDTQGVSIGVAAATKLTFTVEAGSILGAAIHRARSIIDAHQTIAIIIASFCLLLPTFMLIKKYLNINISLKNNQPPTV